MNYLLSLIITMAASLFSSQQPGGFEIMNVDDFHLLFQKGNIQLVDARTHDAYAEAHLAYSSNSVVKDASFI